MIAILKKEINLFFSSPIAYLVIGVFLLINGLFLFVFNDNFNILNAGFADIKLFFFLAPWVFLFLIPAITMKSFSEEYDTGTIELLKTNPISNWQITIGKFIATLLLILITIIPTISYAYTVYKLGSPEGNIDFGSTMGSFLGLLFLGAIYSAIGLFTSSFSKNQVVSFIASVCITFFLFYGFDALALSFNNNTISFAQLGINEHYKSISRGVIDTRDITYFLSSIFFFLFITKTRLDNE